MGIRPTLQLLMAITDFKGYKEDPRWTLDPDWTDCVYEDGVKITQSLMSDYVFENESEEWYVKSWLKCGTGRKNEPIDLEDAVEFYHGEHQADGIFGLIIDKVEYNNYCLWGLRNLHPQYEESSFYELQKMDSEELEREKWYYGRGNSGYAPAVNFALENGFTYKTFMRDTQMWWWETRFIFQHILKMNVSVKDFKCGLHWKWS